MKISFSPLKKVAFLLSFLDPFLPMFLKRLFYRIPFLLLKKNLSRKKIKGDLWLRNSVYFDEMIFPLSDIDLTFFVEGEEKGSRFHLAHSAARQVQFICPHLGELACFDSSGLKYMAPLANAYELKRDPTLFEKVSALGISVDDKSKGSDITFILRWIESDAHQLRESFQRRKRKIERFSKLLDFDASEALCLEELIDDLLIKRQNSIVLNPKEVSFIRSYFLQALDGHRLNDEELRLLSIFFPHRWVGLPIEMKTRSFNLVTPSKDEKNICLSQLRWEVWGLYSQNGLTFNIAERLSHLASLKDLAEKVDGADIVKGCDLLEGLYTTSQGEGAFL